MAVLIQLIERLMLFLRQIKCLKIETASRSFSTVGGQSFSVFAVSPPPPAETLLYFGKEVNSAEKSGNKREFVENRCEWCSI